MTTKLTTTDNVVVLSAVVSLVVIAHAPSR